MPEALLAPVNLSTRKGVYVPYAVVAVLYGLMMSFSGFMKVTTNPAVVAGLHETLGVPLALLPPLGVLLLLGALGLWVGIKVPRVGIAASIGLILYFLGAIVTHLAAGDVKGLTSPLVPLLLACLTLFLARKNAAPSAS